MNPTIISVIQNAAVGALLGVATAFRGYVKMLPDGEKIDWAKAGPTILIGLATGVVAGAFGIEYATAGTLLAGYAITEFANTAWIALMKWWANIRAAKAAKLAAVNKGQPPAPGAAQ